MPSRQLNKNHVQRHFQQAARQYDEAAVVQRKAANRLLEIASSLPVIPGVILDIGCGTGHDSRELSKLFPQSTLISMDLSSAMLEKTRELALKNGSKSKLLCADGEEWPIRPSTVDLLFSNVAFNWFNELEATLRLLHSALNAKGKLLFSFFGPDTLQEIRSAWQQADSNSKLHVNEFISSDDLQAKLSKSGFQLCKLETVNFCVYFESPLKAVQSFRNIGGKNALNQRRKGLTGKSIFQKFLSGLESQRAHEGIPITYEVFLFLLDK